MKIILLSGKPNAGKSTSLNLLFDKITEGGKTHIRSPKKPSDGFDFEAVVEYNNKSVAIVSAGDYYYWCVEAVIKYANIDVLVLAYSDKFVRAPINKIVAKYKYHCVVEKHQATDADNERVCKEILAEI